MRAPVSKGGRVCTGRYAKQAAAMFAARHSARVLAYRYPVARTVCVVDVDECSADCASMLNTSFKFWILRRFGMRPAERCTWVPSGDWKTGLPLARNGLADMLPSSNGG